MLSISNGNRSSGIINWNNVSFLYFNKKKKVKVDGIFCELYVFLGDNMLSLMFV